MSELQKLEEKVNSLVDLCKLLNDSDQIILDIIDALGKILRLQQDLIDQLPNIHIVPRDDCTFDLFDEDNKLIITNYGPTNAH